MTLISIQLLIKYSLADLERQSQVHLLGEKLQGW